MEYRIEEPRRNNVEELRAAVAPEGYTYLTNTQKELATDPLTRTMETQMTGGLARMSTRLDHDGLRATYDVQIIS